MELRPSSERGDADFGWLQSRHSFSFGSYRDPEQIGFSDLLVINEDRVREGRGFDTHGHRDMEIFSYVLEGELEHRDSMGNGSVIRPGDVQMMSAGTGIRHSEYNPSPEQTVHFLQIWIVPDRQGVEPRYRVREGRGFDTHGHRDMEIFSYVLEGELEHRDSMGNGSVIRPGDVQMMSAGTGIRHSEYNPSPEQTVHFLQIWIVPDRQGVDRVTSSATSRMPRSAAGCG
jgi:quercetin 2,3-dioxygenase